MSTQKITQETLDNNKPQKPSYFFLRKIYAYFIMFLLVGGIFSTLITFLLNTAIGTVYSEAHYLASWIFSTVICLFFLIENVLSLPEFVRKICGLNLYAKDLKKYLEMEEEFEKQQAFLELKEKYRDL